MIKTSVCMATFNGGHFIHTQIESILKQLNENDEIIISDDSSTDDTIKIIENFKDCRIKLFKNQKFKNPIYNFENAISNASGDIIFLSDQDDIWLTGKVNIMTAALRTSDLVVSDCFIGDEDLNIIRDSHFEWRDSRNGFIKNLLKNSYLGCCLAFKKEILKKVLPFPKGIPMHDIWIGLICEVFYKPVFIKDKLIIYRRHNLNATQLTDDFKSKASFIKKLSFRTSVLKHIIKKIF